MKKILLAIPALALVCFGCSQCGMCGGNKDDMKTQKHTADWEITTKVKAAIMADSSIGTSARFVSVSTNNGVVTLTGNVPTKYDKEQIGKIAKKVKDVSRVDNQLTVTK